MSSIHFPTPFSHGSESSEQRTPSPLSVAPLAQKVLAEGGASSVTPSSLGGERVTLTSGTELLDVIEGLKFVARKSSSRNDQELSHAILKVLEELKGLTPEQGRDVFVKQGRCQKKSSFHRLERLVRDFKASRSAEWRAAVTHLLKKVIEETNDFCNWINCIGTWQPAAEGENNLFLNARVMERCKFFDRVKASQLPLSYRKGFNEFQKARKNFNPRVAKRVLESGKEEEKRRVEASLLKLSQILEGLAQCVREDLAACESPRQ